MHEHRLVVERADGSFLCSGPVLVWLSSSADQAELSSWAEWLRQLEVSRPGAVDDLPPEASAHPATPYAVIFERSSGLTVITNAAAVRAVAPSDTVRSIGRSEEMQPDLFSGARPSPPAAQNPVAVPSGHTVVVGSADGRGPWFSVEPRHSVPGLDGSAAVARAGIEADATAVTSPAPRVVGRRCRAGHHNPPEGRSCRSCGDDLADADVVSAPRPPLASIQLPDGRLVPLDRSTVVGRRPLPTSHDGRRECATVIVDSPDKLVSRSHFEVSLDGWQMRVIDRGSRNGTRVQGSDREVLLREGQSTVVEVGDIIHFADRTARLVSPDGG